MHQFLLGGVAVASFTVALFFLRYWTNTRDRFFLLFAASFLIEAASRTHMAITSSWNEEELPLHYLVRLLAYGLILLAIWDKNRPGKS